MWLKFPEYLEKEKKFKFVKNEKEELREYLKSDIWTEEMAYYNHGKNIFLVESFHSLVNSADPRFEIYHPSIFSIILAYFILIMIIWIPFSKYQPLKSRGIVPLISVIAQFFILFSDLITFTLTMEQWDPTYCYIWYIIQSPLLLSIVTLPILYTIRYYFLVILNRHKERIIANTKTHNQFNIFYKILKIIRHWLFSLIFFILIYLFYLSIYAGTSFFCARRGTSILDTIEVGIVGGITLIYLLLLLFDTFILSFNRVRKCEWIKLWNEDTLYFKFEIYILGIPMFFIYFIMIFLGSFLNSETFFYFMLTYLYHHLLFFQTLFILILTIIKIIVSCIRKNKSKDHLNVIPESPEFSGIFYEFCKNEFSTENYASYQDIVKLKNMINEDERLHHLEHIYKLYLNGNESQLVTILTN